MKSDYLDSIPSSHSYIRVSLLLVSWTCLQWTVPKLVHEFLLEAEWHRYALAECIGLFSSIFFRIDLWLPQMPVKHPWKIWVNKSCGLSRNRYNDQTKQTWKNVSSPGTGFKIRIVFPCIGISIMGPCYPIPVGRHQGGTLVNNRKLYSD